MSNDTRKGETVAKVKSLSRTSQESRTAIKFSPEEIDVINRVACPSNATDAQKKMFYLFCQTSGFDPIKREAHFAIMDGKPVWMADVNGLQRRADDHDDYEGMDGPHAVYSNDKFLFDAKTGKVSDHQHAATKRGELVAAWGIAYRKGRKPVSEYLEFKEYNAGKANWRRMPATMLKKCVRSALLRRTFASQFGSVYGQEEMDRAIEEAKVVDNESEGAEPEKVLTKDELVKKYKALKDRWPGPLRKDMLELILGRKPEGAAGDLTAGELSTVVEVLENEAPESKEELEALIQPYIMSTDRGQEIQEAQISTQSPVEAPSKEKPAQTAPPPEKAPMPIPDVVGVLMQEAEVGLGVELVRAGMKAVGVQREFIKDLTSLEATSVMKWLDRNHRPPDDRQTAEPAEEAPAPEPKPEKAKPKKLDKVDPKRPNAMFDDEGNPVFFKCDKCQKDIYADGDTHCNPDGSGHACDGKPAVAPPKRESVEQRISKPGGKEVPCHYCKNPMPALLAKAYRRKGRFEACMDCQEKISDGKLASETPGTEL